MNTITMHDLAMLVARFRRFAPCFDEADCWPWTGARNEHGYGIIGSPGRSGPPFKAHRLAVALDGRDPTDRVVRHSCDNPPCVNPTHLIVGTQAENIADGRIRGSYQGEHNGQSKLSAAAVRDIRAQAATRTHTAIAADYGVCQQTVSNIVARKRWAHVE